MDFDFSLENYAHLGNLLGHCRLIDLLFAPCLPGSEIRGGVGYADIVAWRQYSGLDSNDVKFNLISVISCIIPVG